jgi:murein DD-endopeptidase MepM/ murein hydrolase activator NlpD
MLQALSGSMPRALLPVAACLLLAGCGGRAVVPPPRSDVVTRAEHVEPRRVQARVEASADEGAASLAQGTVTEEDLDVGAPPRDTESRAARDEQAADEADQPLTHIVRPGQTLYSLAKMYDVDMKELIRLNKISNPSKVAAGRPILIPAARPQRSEAAPKAASGARDARGTQGKAAAPGKAGAPGKAAPREETAGRDASKGGDGVGAQDPAAQREPGGTQGPAAKPKAPGGRGPDAPQVQGGAKAPRGERLAWPLRGAITAAYGRRGKQAHHSGVDIDGDKGDPILAAASGTVVRADVDGEYGRVVILDHGHGLTTLYAHASKVLVNVGDQVDAGDRIAEVGGSGNARGTHLHFEVRRDEKPVDPVPLLRGKTVLTAGTVPGKRSAGTH